MTKLLHQLAADETHQFVDRGYDGGRPAKISRFGCTVVVEVEGDTPVVEVYPDEHAARAGYANWHCDPAADAPAPGDVIEIFTGPRTSIIVQIDTATPTGTGTGTSTDRQYHTDQYRIAGRRVLRRDGGTGAAVTRQIGFGEYQYLSRPTGTKPRGTSTALVLHDPVRTQVPATGGHVWFGTYTVEQQDGTGAWTKVMTEEVPIVGDVGTDAADDMWAGISPGYVQLARDDQTDPVAVAVRQFLHALALFADPAVTSRVTLSCQVGGRVVVDYLTLPAEDLTAA